MARLLRMVATAALLPIVGCASVASLVRDGRTLEACQRVPPQGSLGRTAKEQRVGARLLAASGARIRVRHLTTDELTVALGHAPPAGYQQTSVTLVLELRQGKGDVQIATRGFNLFASDGTGDMDAYSEALGVPRQPHSNRRPGAPATTWAQVFAMIGHVATGGSLFLVARASGHDPSALLPAPGTQPGYSQRELADLRAWGERRDVQAVALLFAQKEGAIAHFARVLKPRSIEPQPPPHRPDVVAYFSVRVGACSLDTFTNHLPLRGTTLHQAAADLESRGWIDVASLVD